MKDKYIIKNTIIIILVIIIFIILNITFWYKNIFSDIRFEQLVFHLRMPLDNSNNSEVIYNFLEYFAKKYIFIMLFLFFIIFLITYLSKYFNHKHSFKKITINDDRNLILIITIISFILTTAYSIDAFKVSEYVKNTINSSTIFEQYYINPKETKITFPKEKRNLIYIYLESMESSFNNHNIDEIDIENLIPNLSTIARTHTHFSNTTLLGGAKEISGTTWTVAGLVSQTSGLPLKIAIDCNGMSEFNEFLPGLTSLGEILEDAGYNNYFLLGSKKEFGGRDKYFENHENYEIFDYNKAVKENKIDEDYFVWWGYEDAKLYEYAKEQLLNISSKKEPFNFTMLTADTHFLEGYKDETCENITSNKYADSVICADKKINDFINWIQKQNFYENTTIIISGDHLLMGNYLYKETYNKERTIYNAIINSPIEPINKTNRIFTTLDMFPTTLASLGVTIEGDKLALGTNLFSNKKTIAEEIGIDTFDKELAKKSNYYDKNILYKD